MEKKTKFADLFEIGNFKSVKINKTQLKLVIGGRGNENDNPEDSQPVIDIDLDIKSYTLNHER